jgi:hypothetical protein
MVAMNKFENSFKVWHKQLLHTGEETILQTMKAISIQAKKLENWVCTICILAKVYKKILREKPTRLNKPCTELYIDTILMKLFGFRGFN